MWKWQKIYLDATSPENCTHKLRLIWNSLCCSKETPSKNVQLWQFTVMKLSFTFEFQIVSFAFRLLLGGPFVVFSRYSMGKGDFIPKKLFMRANLWGIFPHGGTNDHMTPMEEEFYTIHFPVFYHCKSEKFSQPWWKIYLKISFTDHYIELWKDLSLRLIVSKILISKIVPCCMGYWYAIWNVNTRNRDWICKHPLHTIHLGLAISWKVCLLFKYF